MRKIFLTVAALLLPLPASAAAITVFATGMVGTGIRTLAASWSTETGNTVTFVGGSVPTVETAVTSGQPGDVVILPTGEFANLTARVKPGAATAIGRIPFGLGVAAGAPHPDVSTEAGLQAVLKGARMVSYNQPSLSLAGVAVQKLLARPGYDGVKVLLLTGGSAGAVARGDADMTLGVLTEELSTKGVEVAGELPAALNIHIDFSGAVTSDSPQPAAAASFLAYVSRAQASAVWKAGGVVAPIP